MLNRLKSIVYRLFKHRTVGKFKDNLLGNELKLMTCRQSDIAHALIGICTETGELQDAFKKHWVYGQPLDIENVAEEVGDLLFYLQALCIAVDIEIGDCIKANVDKLNRRFPEGYTDQAAKERADKLQVVDAEEVDSVLAVDPADGKRKLAKIKDKYRFLEIGEKIKKGDEFLHGDNMWVEQPWPLSGRKDIEEGDPQFRRKLKPKKKKWRRLKVGEVVQKGDQHKFNDVWEPTSEHGKTMSPRDVSKGKYRRRIKKKDKYADGRPDPGEGFRLLKAGETIQEHDEYYSQTDGEWITTISGAITTVVDRKFITAYRRKIE